MQHARKCVLKDPNLKNVKVPTGRWDRKHEQGKIDETQDFLRKTVMPKKYSWMDEARQSVSKNALGGATAEPQKLPEVEQSSAHFQSNFLTSSMVDPSSNPNDVVQRHDTPMNGYTYEYDHVKSESNAYFELNKKETEYHPHPSRTPGQLSLVPRGVDNGAAEDGGCFEPGHTQQQTPTITSPIGAPADQQIPIARELARSHESNQLMLLRGALSRRASMS